MYRKPYKAVLISLKMDKTDSNRNIFIVKIRGKENSKTIQIPDSICEFCDIKLGDLIKLEIIEIKTPNKNRGKSKK